MVSKETEQDKAEIMSELLMLEIMLEITLRGEANTVFQWGLFRKVYCSRTLQYNPPLLIY